MRMTLTAMAMVAMGLVSATVASAQGDFGQCSAGTGERLGFIEDRLELRRPYAKYYWIGWTGFYGLGTVVQSYRAATQGDESKQADEVVSAVKALIGTTRLVFWPPTAKAGADAMRVVATNDETACRERLRIGEELLRKNARESKGRWDWYRHASNVGLNVAGGLVIHLGWDDPSRGWRSAAIGTAVGEVFIFSHPWKADEDLAEYEQKFGTNPELAPRKISFELAPRLGGLAFNMKF